MTDIELGKQYTDYAINVWMKSGDNDKGYDLLVKAYNLGYAPAYLYLQIFPSRDMCQIFESVFVDSIDINIYKKAAEQKFYPGVLLYIQRVLKEVDSSLIYFEELFHLLTAVEDENILMKYMVGEMYYYGLGVELNYSKAIEKFKETIKMMENFKIGDSLVPLNIAFAYCYKKLGICYFLGLGTIVDYNKAFTYLSIGYDKSYETDDEAGYYLARCYEFGLGCEKNVQKAIELYDYCACFSSSDVCIGYLYETGKYLKKDLVKAFEKYRSAYQYMTCDQLTLISKDIIDQFVKKDTLDPFAIINYGRCLYLGIGCDIDYREAFKVFSKGEKLHNADIDCWIGYCYYNGNGTSIDKERSKKFFTNSAEEGSTFAKEFLDKYF